MHAERIINYIQHPENMDEQTLPEMDRLIGIFPYFQTAHMLLLKNRYNLGSIDFNEKLKHSAAFISDRSVLYHLINRKENQMRGESGRSGINQSVTDQLHIPVYQLVADQDHHASGTGDQDLQQGEPARDYEPAAGKQPRSLSFTGWLSYLNGKRTTGPLESDQQGSYPDQKYLIDEFIKKSPTIKAAGKGDQQMIDVSETSARPDDHLLTETLARIYAKQGYLEKAVRTYEMLGLKYPEKNAYFATRVEELKAGMNQSKKT